ncbi:conserved hypothetical protein [Burkholderia sp. 8Y]|uniref:hypothetical protein n=1 Tax=Burkholderia sp. 8Y TaxID=2653133 RepID=UPI0012F0C40F|nr:hypothetical protein [Burkholderia sp. 8Y]VXC04329.1 conserved hypothetical protein [Burkholderia sp. 8Y]
MTEPMITLMVGVVVVLCAIVILVMHHKHPNIYPPKARWLDTHPPRDWTHRRH